MSSDYDDQDYAEQDYAEPEVSVADVNDDEQYDDGTYDDQSYYYDDVDRPSAAELLEANRQFRNWMERQEREKAGQPSIEQFFVQWHRLTRAQVEAVNTTLEAATSEAELQMVLEDCPEILVQVLRGGQGRWLIPQKRLGGDHVTDFVIAEKHSLGFEWMAVELESPTARLFNRNGDASAVLNHAIRQILDWRDWLSHNRDYATRPRGKSGLGLIDIDPQLAGLIIIGRRQGLDESTADRRRSMSRELRIEIRTYDWLIETARGAAHAMDPE